MEQALKKKFRPGAENTRDLLPVVAGTITAYPGYLVSDHPVRICPLEAHRASGSRG